MYFDRTSIIKIRVNTKVYQIYVSARLKLKRLMKTIVNMLVKPRKLDEIDTANELNVPVAH